MDAIKADPAESDINEVVETIAEYSSEYVDERDIEQEMSEKGYSGQETLFLLIQAEAKGKVKKKHTMIEDNEYGDSAGTYYFIDTS